MNDDTCPNCYGSGYVDDGTGTENVCGCDNPDCSYWTRGKYTSAEYAAYGVRRRKVHDPAAFSAVIDQCYADLDEWSQHMDELRESRHEDGKYYPDELADLLDRDYSRYKDDVLTGRIQPWQRA